MNTIIPLLPTEAIIKDRESLGKDIEKILQTYVDEYNELVKKHNEGNCSLELSLVTMELSAKTNHYFNYEIIDLVLKRSNL